MNRNNGFLFVVLSGFILLTSACSAQTAKATPTPTLVKATQTPVPTETDLPTATATLTPTPTIIMAGPEEYPDGMNPLTGLEVEDERLLQRRPVMIKVSNFPRDGRPHAGLSNADLVFDYYIGEGTNRFLALYYGEIAEKVGPIRSGRLVDAQLVRLYQGILGYASADQYNVNPTLLNQLGKRAISESPKTCPAICDQGDHTVFSVFANTEQLSTFYQQLSGETTFLPDLRGMVFNSTPPKEDAPAETLSVKFNAYNIGEWRYDSETGTYLRWIEEVDSDYNLTMIPLTDQNTGDQIHAENVILIFAPYQQISPTLHEIGLWNNINGQRAVLFRDGKILEGIWKSPGTDRPLQFFTPEGDSLALKPGKTWIVLGGLSSTLEETDSGLWTFQFYLP